MDVNAVFESLQSFIAAYALKVVGAILTLIIGFWVIGRISSFIRRALERRNVDVSVRPFLASLVSLGLKAMLLLSVASMFGIQVTSFIAIFSALAFAVGLALQGNLANFASGVLVLVFKPYRVGDFIEADGQKGVVREIQIFHTVLQGLDNRLVIIPNGQVTDGPIINYTALGERRHDLTVGIGYDDDIDKAKQAIEKVLRDTPNLLLDKGYKIFVKELGANSVNFAVRFWAKNDDFWPAFEYFMEHVKKEFDRQEIGIPYPQMDLHVKGLPNFSEEK